MEQKAPIREKKASFGRIFWASLLSGFTLSVLGWLFWILIFSSLIPDNEFTVKRDTVLHMTLSGPIGERTEATLNTTSLSMEDQLGVANILFALDKAKTDPKIKGIFLEVNSVACGMATAREIRDAINDFEESGKFVVAYLAGEMVTMKSYYIASAANESYGFKGARLEFLGLGGELMYYKGLLDKLDVEMQVIRGSDNDFKSAVEPFLRTEASDSARLQTEVYMKSIWKTMREDIAKDKGMTPYTLDSIAETAAVVDIEDAVAFNMVDATMYRDEVMDIVDKRAKSKDSNWLSFKKYAKEAFYKDQKRRSRDGNIAVILAEGDITRDGDGLTSTEICELLEKARNKKSVKTVILRVNSPGGSALASDEIWREVVLTNEKKKVIVSMGDLAASGGYFISAPGAKIFAEPNTITGSIGVFGLIPYTGKMLENKLGITFSQVGTNKYSVFSLNKRLTEDEYKRVQGEIDQTYSQFKQIVADGRNLSVDEVGVIARGRVWTGVDALEIGLVDELGGLTDAIDYAAKEAGISEQKVLYYPITKKDRLTEFIETLEEEEESTLRVKSNELPQELVAYYEELKKLEAMYGIQMRLPAEIIIE